MTDRELVIAAAEKVMGWKIFSSGRGSIVACEHMDTMDERERILYTTHPWESVEWNPLESIADAWMLVEAVQAKLSVFFRIGSNPWVASFASPSGTHVVAIADTAPRAIVWATLRAVGVTA